MREAATPSRPPLALIANDQEWSARSLESILAPAGYSILRAYSGQQAVDRARAARPELIILDLNLPDLPGTEVCRILRADPRVGASTPILMTTAGPSMRTRRLDALRAGAWDFLGLPMDAEEFQLKVGVLVRAKREADLHREQTLVDEMSGLYNSKGILRRAREIGSEAYRHHRALACVVFAPDLEEAQRAEAEEDPAARLAGEIAEVFRASSRTSDAVGRLGRTDFVVLAPATDSAGAVRLAKRILEASRRGVGGADPGSHPFRLRAGCYAVPDFREAALEPVDVLVRATMALRQAQANPAGEAIRSFNGTDEPVD